MDYTDNVNIKKNKKIYKKNCIYSLRYLKKIVGFINIDSLYSIDKKLHNKKIFQSNSKNHPGVVDINKIKNSFAGGVVSLLKNKIPKDKLFFFNQLRLINNICRDSSAVFSTRNICHR